VYYTYSRTQLYFTQQYSRYRSTCFGPICGPSSGCDLTYREAVQDVWGVLLGYWGLSGGGGGGRDLVVLNSEYLDLGLVTSELSLVVYIHVSK